MSIESIQNSLTERFQKPLEEYYTRRIVFWEDAAGAFASEVDKLSIDGVKILKLTGKNYFAAKKLLLHDDKNSNYLVYDPCCYPNEEEDYLYSVKRYSGEIFYADKVSMEMEEFGIVSTPEMREALKYYPRFFDNKERTEKLKSFGRKYENAYELHRAILCALCGIEFSSLQDIIITVLMAGTDDAQNKLLEQIEKFGSIQIFWAMVHKATGYTVSQSADNLSRLAAHILFSAASECLQVSLKKYNQYISVDHAAFCHGLVNDMIYYQDAREVLELFVETEKTFGVEEYLAGEEINKICECDVFPCVNKIILNHFLDEINENIISAENILAVIEKRKAIRWYSSTEVYFECLAQIAHMQLFFQKWGGTFHEVDPQRVWELYTTELSKMDRYYRHFHAAFVKCLKTSLIELDDAFKNAAEVVEKLYQNWYLKELSAMWLNAADEYLLDSRGIAIERQIDFYENRVKPEKDTQSIFVIISDALRFEVAADLMSAIEKNCRGRVRLESMKSVFPSVTSFGMAALLPGKKEVAQSGEITVNALPCKSTEQRKAVLQATDAMSVAVQYKDFIAMKKQERNALITGNKVIYIYHNTIDAIGDKAPTETKVFEACEEAIEELQNLVKIITGLRSGAKIVITADHGFLYTYFPLTESQKISTGTMSGIVKSGRRFVIGNDKTECAYLQPVQMEINTAQKELTGFTPRDTIRLKQSGGGENYVHGGASLQEMCVPVIEFKGVRADSKQFKKHKEQFEMQPVEVTPLSTTKRITNMIFTVNFLQLQPVDQAHSAMIFETYFTDEYDNKVSDVQRIVADKDSPEAPDRQFRCRYNLKSQKYDANRRFYLIVTDENQNEVLKEEFQIDIPFAVDDFGFFG